MDAITLRAVMTLDKSQYEQGLDTAEKNANSFSGRFSKAMKVGGAAVAAVGAASVVMGKKFVDGIKATAAYGDNVDKMSQKIGISAESYQKWDYVMQRAGMSVDTLKMGMKTLSSQAEKNSDAFQRLGISQEEVANLSKEDLLQKTIEGLAGMEDSTERTALATQLLGRAGADMGPLLNGGTEAIKEQMEMAEKYGMVMSDDVVKASATFEDSVTTMSMTLQGLKNRMMGEFLPAATKVTDGLGKLFMGDMSGVDDIKKGIDEVLAKISKMIPKIIEIGGEIVMQLATSLIKSIPKLAKSATSIILSLVMYIVKALPQMVTAAIQILVTLVNGISKALPLLIPAAVDAIIQITMALIDNIDLLVDAAITLALAIAEGLIKAIPQLVKAIPKIVSALFLALLKSLPKFLGAGGSLVLEIVKGFLSKVSVFKDAVTSVFNSIKKIIVNIVTATKNVVATVFNVMRNRIVTPIKNAVNSVKNLFGNMKLSVAQKINEMRNFVSEKFNSIKEGMLSPIRTARDAIKRIIDKIKGFFRFKFELPHIKLPHFSIHPKGWKLGDLLQGSIPSLGIDWYKKAYDQPYVFSKPTVVGGKGFGDGVGDEIVYGRNNLLRDIKHAVGANKNNLDGAVINLKVELDGKIIGQTVTPIVNGGLYNQARLDRRNA